MSNPKTLITKDLYDYAQAIANPENPHLIQIREYTQSLDNAIMQIPKNQADFMAFLAKIINAKKYLEIGVFTGYSALAVSLAMGKSGITYALDNSPKHIEIATKFWQNAGYSENIKPYVNDAEISLQQLVNDGHADTFDMAFIDANKSDYPLYFEYCYKLVRQGGIILLDNVFMHGMVLQSDAPKYAKIIDEFNHKLSTDQRVVISVLAIADGLTLVYKK